MRICWYSNAPWAQTGYGQQTAEIVPYLAARYGVENVAISNNYGLSGSMQRWQGVRVYPTGRTTHSDEIAPVNALTWFDGQPGMLFTLYDVWALQGPAWDDVPVVSWVPVDHDPCPPAVADWLRGRNAAPLAMSRFGQRALAEQGLDAFYVPHSINTDIYRPVEDARAQFDIPADRFVIGMVANNKSREQAPHRKAFGEVFAAFAQFHRTHPDSLLWLHTDEFGFNGGTDLDQLAELCRLPEGSYRFSDQHRLVNGTTPEEMAALYTSFDVLAAPSLGEGFGIPVIEAQACGTPVIVSDFTAQPELVGAGMCVSGQRWPDMAQRSWWQIPNIEELSDSFAVMYDRSARAVRDDADNAIKKASEYHTPRVWTECWEPTLSALECRLPAVTPINI